MEKDNNEAMPISAVAARLEALLYVSGEPLEINEAAKIIEVKKDTLMSAVSLLKERYGTEESGLELLEFSDKLQLATKSCYADCIDRFFSPKGRQSLSKSALEVLSIVAYKQPITRMEIEDIRGVRCEYAIGVLRQHNLIAEVGRKEALGRPVLYGTTEEFLRDFSLKSIDELPNREELTATEMSV